MELLKHFWQLHHTEIIHVSKALLISLLVVLISWLVARIIRNAIFKAVEKIEKIDKSSGKVFFNVIKVFIWIFALMIILDQFGVNTASLITVLGTAGLAIGLAIKDSLSNVAAGLMLFILHPYKTGDYVDCGTVSGTIRQMGLFSTELQTVDGLYVLIPNSAIIAAPVKNYSRNPLRRADIPVGIAYEDSLETALKILNDLMAAEPRILTDPVPEVLVAELADNSVNLTLRFWTSQEEYWDVYWKIKSELKNTVETAGLHIPFPQRVITLATPLPENK